MIYRIFFLSFCLFLFSCEESTQTVETQEYGLSLSTLAWNPSNFPTGGRIQLSLSEDMADVVLGSTGDLGDETWQVANLWDESVAGINFFQSQINIVPNLDYENLESYWDPAGQTQIGIYNSEYWFNDVPSQAVAITQFYAVADSINGRSYYRLLHADIIFNSRNHDFSMSTNDSQRYHFPTVLLHELGHLLGLEHNLNFSSGSIMIPSFHRNYVQAQLSDVDENNLVNKYKIFNGRSSGLNFAASSSGSLRGKQIKRFVRYLMQDGDCELHDHTHHIHPNYLPHRKLKN